MLNHWEGRRSVLDRLSARDPGPERCGQGCVCETDLDLSPDQAARSPGSWDWSPGRDAVASRIGQWRALTAAAAAVQRTADSVRLVLPARPEMIAAAAALCAAETECCAQVRFGLQITASQVTVTAHAPGSPGLLDLLVRADQQSRR